MVGKKYGHLTVVSRDGSDKYGHTKWLCRCDCGNPKQISVLGDNLRRGHTQYCGCERRSHVELKIAQLLNENNVPFEQEVSLFKFANGTNARFDFYVDDKYLIEYDGEEYVILLPVEEEVSEEPGEVVILKLENTSDEEESYVSVDDEEILNNVFEIFKEKFKDEFNFTDQKILTRKNNIML